MLWGVLACVVAYWLGWRDGRLREREEVLFARFDAALGRTGKGEV